MVKKGFFIGVGLMVSLFGIQPVLAADVAHGKMLHEKSCQTSCHADKANGDANGLYQRKGRMDSLEKVRAQVAFCNQQVLKSEWFPEDEADVVEYLNTTFYHFK